MKYRYGSHTIYKTQYHFVFVTKYRYPVLQGNVGLKVRELIRQTCLAFEIEILSGVVSKVMIISRQTHERVYLTRIRDFSP